MLKPTQRTIIVPRYLNPVIFGAIGFCAAIGLTFYIAAPEFEAATTTAPEPRVPDRTANTSESGRPVAAFSPRTESNVAQPPLRILSPADAAIDQLSPELSAEEIRLLHAQQQGDLERLVGDLDAIVIGANSGGATAITVRELRALHEQQQRDSESVDDAEVVIPTRADGSPALTVADVRALHVQQEEAIDATPSSDEVVITGSANGGVDLTRGEITALHERQHAALADAASVADDYPAGVGDDRRYALTVHQLRELHESQSPE